MVELLPFAEKWGPWVLILVFATTRIVPALVARFLPDSRSEKRRDKRLKAEAVQDDLAALVSVYERFITTNETMVKFIGSSTSAINGMERALDGNTRTVVELVKAVERGPKCPLPGCPYWQFEDREEKGGEG